MVTALIAVSANEMEIVGLPLPRKIASLCRCVQKQDDASRQRCQGMYSRKSWGGSVDPFILTKFSRVTPKDNADPLVSLVIFEFRDEDLIGRYIDGDKTKVWTFS
jgi:hypothetical protein